MDRKVLFFIRMREFAAEQQKIVNNAINELENYLAFRDMKDKLYRDISLPTVPQEDEIILRAIGESSEVSVKLNLDCEAAQGGDERESKMSDMPSVQPIDNKEVENLKHITKRSDGRWQASKIVNGKRKYVYGKTQLEAREKLRNIEKPNAGKKVQRESLYQFSLWWLANCKKGLAVSTIKTYKGIIKTHLKISTPIDKVTLHQLQELLGNLPATRIREEVYKIIRPIMRKAYELEYIKRDFAQFLELGKITRNTRTALSVEEQRSLVAELLRSGDIASRRTMFYLCTGVRPSEIETLRKEEMRPGWLKVNGTKNAGSVRWVKISDKLYQMLQHERKEFFVFNRKRYLESLQDLCARAGIERAIDVYTLRHTFATNLYIMRVPEKDRQVYMGHSLGSKITNEVYTTFSPDVTPQDIYNIFGEFLPKF